MKYLVMDNLTQDILGVFASMEEAIESAEYQSAAHPTLLATLKEGDTFDIKMFYLLGATPFAEHPQFTGAWFKLAAKPNKEPLTVRVTRIYPESEWKRAGKRETFFFVGEAEVVGEEP